MNLQMRSCLGLSLLILFTPACQRDEKKIGPAPHPPPWANYKHLVVAEIERYEHPLTGPDRITIGKIKELPNNQFHAFLQLPTQLRSVPVMAQTAVYARQGEPDVTQPTLGMTVIGWIEPGLPNSQDTSLAGPSGKKFLEAIPKLDANILLGPSDIPLFFVSRLYLPASIAYRHDPAIWQRKDAQERCFNCHERQGHFWPDSMTIAKCPVLTPNETPALPHTAQQP